MRRAVIYDRISDDATGEAAGVQRQSDDNTRFCQQRGWTVVAHLTDNDISASRYSTKKRRGFEQAIGLIESGQADALVGWHLDRLWRQPKELEHLIDLVEHKDVIVATLNGDIDLNNADGRFQARILVSVAAKASDDSSRRIRRKMRELAEQGRLAGRTVFGYTQDATGQVIINPVEAQLITDAAAALLAGDTLSSVAASWERQEVPHRQGGVRWTTSHVRRILTNPFLTGKRIHNGELFDAQWEPILDEVTRTRLLRVFAANASKAGNRGKRRLTTGLIVCACGNIMSRNIGSDGIGRTRCHPNQYQPACGHNAIPTDELEALIIDSVFALDDRHLAALGADDTQLDVLADIAALEAKLGSLSEQWAADELTDTQLRTASASVRKRIAALTATVVPQVRPEVLANLASGSVIADRWDTWTLPHQRAVLGALIERVVIEHNTNPRCRPSWDERRVTVVWR